MKKLHNHSTGWLLIVISLTLNIFAFGWGGIHEASASSNLLEPKSEFTTSNNQIYDDSDSAWTYKGNWSETNIRGAYKSKLHISSTVGDNASLSIAGIRFTLIFTRGSGYGTLDVYMDGHKIGTVNQNRSRTSSQREWTSPGIGPGSHTIRLVHASGKNVNIDAIRVRIQGPESTPTNSPVNTVTATATLPGTFTPIVSASATQRPTFTAIFSPTSTLPINNPTLTFTPKATASPTIMITASETPSQIPSLTSIPTTTTLPTSSSTATNTSVPTFPSTTIPTATNTPTLTAVPTITVSSSPTTGLKVYYVAVSGSDSNPGTQAQPWRSIQKAARTLVAGDTVYVRGGVYNESVSISNSGIQGKPIRFLAYPGETPVIDGNNYQLPTTHWGELLNLSGSYIQVSGIEVRYSNWVGVVLSGHHNLASNMNVHHNRETGMLVSGDYGIVENCRVWQNANRNETNSPYGQGGWATGLSAARHPNYAILRGNTIYNNWGEGLSTFEANGTTMENNVVYDNWSANVYISDATNVTMQRNLVYVTANSIITSGSQVGIMMGDEKYNPPSSNITVINNLVYGARRNFYWWPGDQGGGMVNVLIANNTFVNSSYGSGVQIDRGSHQNVRFYNNIVQQDGTLPVAAIDSVNGITFSHNLWSKKPSSNVPSSGDIIGDSKLARTSTITSPEWYQLQVTSPAINAAVRISEVIEDYFGKSRGETPDIGALEYSP